MIIHLTLLTLAQQMPVCLDLLLGVLLMFLIDSVVAASYSQEYQWENMPQSHRVTDTQG